MAETPTVALVPLAALHPAPWNPRTIRDDRFKNLCDSIQADPAFIWRRPILAQLDGTIYAGNMRYRAAEHLGMAEVPAIVEDVPDTLAKERALRDNAQWGDWDDDELARLVGELQAAESNMDLLGLEEAELRMFLASEVAMPSLPDGDRLGFQQMTFTLSDAQAETVKNAIDVAKHAGEFGETGNENSNGNALTRLAEAYVGES